jgi:hypothetical protein
MNPDRLRFYRNTLHPFLSILIPFLLLLSVETFVRAMVLHAVLPLPGYFWLLLPFVGMIEAVSANRLAEEGSSSIAPRLRELLLILIGILVLFMLTQGHLLRGDINPLKPDVLYPLALTFVYWVVVFSLHRNMREREAFLALIVNQDGEQLKNAFRDYAEEATISSARMGSLRRAVLWAQSLSLISFLVLLISVEPIEAWWTMIAVGHLAFGLVFLSIVNSFIEEQQRLGEGLSLTAPLQKRRARATVLTLLITVAVVLPLTGREAVLPAEAIGTFIEWLEERLKLPEREVKVKVKEIDKTEVFQEIQREPDLGDLSGDRTRSQFLQNLVRIVLITIGALILIGLLYFLIRPLLSRDYRERLRENRPLARVIMSIRRFFLTLVTSVQSMIATLRRSRSSLARFGESIVDRVRERSAARAAARAREAVLDKQRQRTVGQASKAFVRLIRWAERGGVSYRKWLGPLEYVLMIAERSPGQTDILIEIGTIFEEIAYAANDPDQGRTQTYYDRIKEVIRHRMQEPTAAA